MLQIGWPVSMTPLMMFDGIVTSASTKSCLWVWLAMVFWEAFAVFGFRFSGLRGVEGKTSLSLIYIKGNII